MSDSESHQTFINTAVSWVNRFNDLTVRERAIVSLCAILATTLIWFFLILPISTLSVAAAERELLMVESEIGAKIISKRELSETVNRDPNESIRVNMTAVEAELAATKSKLTSSLSRFISPGSMVLVLRDLMSDHKNLKLTYLNRLPARQLLSDEEPTNLYLHPLEIELEGEYLDVLSYISSLEKGDWKFNWQAFEYKTKGYPNGVATLKIETLSEERHWLGL